MVFTFDQFGIIKRKIFIYSKIVKNVPCKDFVKYTQTKNVLNFYIRGTCSLSTLVTDFDVRTGLYKNIIGASVDVHHGWSTLANDIFIKHRELFIKAIKKNKTIFLVGASMGAAVCAYLTHHILSLQSSSIGVVKIQAILLCSPKSVPPRIARAIHKYSTAIINPRDAITYTPLTDSLVIPGRVIKIEDITFKATVYDNYVKYKKSIKGLNIIPNIYPSHLISHYVYLLHNVIFDRS